MLRDRFVPQMQLLPPPVAGCVLVPATPQSPQPADLQNCGRGPCAVDSVVRCVVADGECSFVGASGGDADLYGQRDGSRDQLRRVTLPAPRLPSTTCPDDARAIVSQYEDIAASPTRNRHCTDLTVCDYPATQFSSGQPPRAGNAPT